MARILHSSNGESTGVVQPAASYATEMAARASRQRMIRAAQDGAVRSVGEAVNPSRLLMRTVRRTLLLSSAASKQ